ncbi:hypothetical protein TNCV_3104711 [Trichonephila clavipes]|nr:hypothetical protein TNCV_3104711 [Trichonephila clavipes]
MLNSSLTSIENLRNNFANIKEEAIGLAKIWGITPEFEKKKHRKRASLPYTAGLQWYWARTRDKASHDPMPMPLGYRGHHCLRVIKTPAQSPDLNPIEHV